MQSDSDSGADSGADSGDEEISGNGSVIKYSKKPKRWVGCGIWFVVRGITTAMQVRTSQAVVGHTQLRLWLRQDVHQEVGSLPHAG